MSGAGPNGAVPIVAPPAAPPRFSLVSSALPGDPDGEGRWQNGVRFQPERCLPTTDVSYWWDCPGEGGDQPTADDNTKVVADGESVVDYRPYTIVAGDKCSSFGWSERDYQARATRYLMACESRLIEAELWTGAVAQAAAFPNAYLDDGNATVIADGGSGIPFARALAEVEQAACACSCGQVFIHAQPRVVSAWANAGLVRQEGRRLLTIEDNVVVPGCGYTGEAEDGTAASATESFVYATSPIVLLRSDVRVFPETFGEALDRTENLIEFRAERTVAAFWPDCCQVGTSVDLVNETAAPIA